MPPGGVPADSFGHGGDVSSSTSFPSRENSNGDRDPSSLSSRPPFFGSSSQADYVGRGRNLVARESGRSEDDEFRDSRRDDRRCCQRSSQQLDSVAEVQRSVADLRSSPSSNPLTVNNQIKSAGDSVDDDLRSGIRCDRKLDISSGSFNWKPGKWSRSVSISSSLKASIPGSEDRKHELLSSVKKVIPTGSASLHEGPYQKKQRLGWGQGLAKHEKKKLEGPDNLECISVHRSSDSSPMPAALPKPTSPVTKSDSFQRLLEKLSSDSEYMSRYSLGELNSVIAESLCREDLTSEDSYATRSPAVAQLLLLKNAISKQLEKIESAIDLSENERKKLNLEGLPEMSNSGSSSMAAMSEVTSSSTTEKNSEDHDDIVSAIIDCNRDSAKRSSEFLFMGSSKTPANSCESSLPSIQGDLCIRRKLAVCKNSLRFKERVVALKHRTLRHLWKHHLKSHGTSKKSRPTSSSAFSLSSAVDMRPRIYRAKLRMPAMILLEAERSWSRFMTSNGQVDDPCAVEKERSLVNPWSTEEREAFLHMFGLVGKDFSKIAAAIPHKTTADCVEFYYKSHKSDCFQEVRKSLNLMKQQKNQQMSSYLLAASLQKLRHRARKPSLDEAVLMAKEEAVSSCITTSFSQDGGCISRGNDEAMLTAKEEAVSSCITTSFSQDGTCSDESCIEAAGGNADWTDEEKSIFLEALSLSGQNFARISLHVGTRSEEQCRVFFTKARRSLGLDELLPAVTPLPLPLAAIDDGSEPYEGCVVDVRSFSQVPQQSFNEEETVC